MDPNHPSTDEIVDEGDARVRNPAPLAQPRQPHDLQGLLRFAMEAKQEGPEGSVDQPTEPPTEAEITDRREFLAEVLDNLMGDSLLPLRTILPLLTDAEKIGKLHNKETICYETKEAFVMLMQMVEDPHTAGGFCSLNGFDMFPLCYKTRNPELWSYTNETLAEICQNSEHAQVLAKEKGLIVKLIELLKDPLTRQRRDAVVYAMSSIVRGQDDLSLELITLGGVKELVPQLSSETVRLKIKTARLLLTLLSAHPDETKSQLIEYSVLDRISPQLDQEKQPYTEHFLALTHAFINVTYKTLSQTSDSVLELRRVLQKLIASPSVMEDPEQNKEIIDYAMEMIDMLGYKQTPVYDCGEEADR